MKCVADKYIPYLKGRLEPFFDEVYYLEPREITCEVLLDIDIILIRTRTKCNKSLLKGTKVKFIGTATIGTDHIDLDYCLQNGITVCNAPGCNSRGVAQYVESALYRFGIKKLESGISLSEKSIGIIGVGHVGKMVVAMAQRLGLKPLLYDPPRQRFEGGNQWTADLRDVAERSDIITVHTPLTLCGNDKTYHLINADFLKLCKPEVIIINAARGGVIDEQAVLQFSERAFKLVIDTWENEPDINLQLLQKAAIATPHIAGYSDEGKRNATRMVLEQLAQYMHCDFDTAGLATSSDPLPIYDIMNDDRLFRANPQDFEYLRQHYHFR